MRFALMTEPQQGLSYEEILAIARAAEAAGFEAFFRSDHFGSFPQSATLPTTDAWATLAGLARETQRIRIGALVSPVTFRIPGAFAKLVATVQEMSGGRVEAGVGAGWNEVEHAQIGIPYPETRERVDQLEEELQILHGLWEGPDGWSFVGTHWQVIDSRFMVRPVPRPNIILGGSGKPRSLELGARYADEYNMSSSTPEECRAAFERLAEACVSVGRDAGSVTRSVMAGCVVGRDDADLRERAAALIAFVAAPGTDPVKWIEDRRERWIIGTPDAARARLAEFVAAGAERIVLQDFLPRDLEHVKVMAEIFFG